MDVKNILYNNPGGNTGVGPKFGQLGFVKALIFVPAGKQYPTSSIAAFKTALEADILADLPYNRAFPLQGLVKPTDSSTKPVTETFPDGSIAIVNNGFYDLEYQFLKGGLNLSIALQKSNGKNWWFFIVDDQVTVRGVDAGPGFMTGINPNLTYTPPAVMNTGTNVAVYSTRVNFTPNQLGVDGCFLDFTQDGGLNYLTNLNGLLDVNIYQAAARAAGVFKVGANVANGSVDLHAEFPSELAVVGAFQVRNKATGKPLTVTAVADDPTDNGWSVTVSASDPNYTAGAGTLQISLAGPTELNGLISGGYESNWLDQ